MITSYNAFQKFENTGIALADKSSDIEASYHEYFKSYRKFIRPAGEYYLLHKAYMDDLKIIDRKSYHNLLILYRDKLPLYQKEFFNERNKLRFADKDHWISLHSIYKHLADCWNNITHMFNIFIVSNKDKVSIELLMNHFNLSINENQIFGAEHGNDKSKTIANIIDETLISPENINFIDDNIDNLKSVKDLGINLYQAMWGYENSYENDDPTIQEIYIADALQLLQ